MKVSISVVEATKKDVLPTFPLEAFAVKVHNPDILLLKGLSMPRPYNPFARIAKRLASLRVKADKVNAEIAAVTSLVSAEEKKLTGRKAGVVNPLSKPVRRQGSSWDVLRGSQNWITRWQRLPSTRNSASTSRQSPS